MNSVDLLVNEIEEAIKTHLDTIELLIISSKFKIIRYLYEPRFELENLCDCDHNYSEMSE